MKELEVKILEIDRDAVERRLLRIGATKIFDGIVSSVHYDFPNGRLARRDRTLRLRDCGTHAELALKLKKGKSVVKVREEYQIAFPQYGEAAILLRALGLKPVRHSRKHRTSYSLIDAHVEIDTIPRIPPYLEVEASSRRRLEEVVRSLGYAMRDTVPYSTNDLLRHYHT